MLLFQTVNVVEISLSMLWLVKFACSTNIDCNYVGSGDVSYSTGPNSYSDEHWSFARPINVCDSSYDSDGGYYTSEMFVCDESTSQVIYQQFNDTNICDSSKLTREENVSYSSSIDKFNCKSDNTCDYVTLEYKEKENINTTSSFVINECINIENNTQYYAYCENDNSITLERYGNNDDNCKDDEQFKYTLTSNVNISVICSGKSNGGNNNNDNNNGNTVIIIIASVIGVILIGLFTWYIIRRNRNGGAIKNGKYQSIDK